MRPDPSLQVPVLLETRLWPNLGLGRKCSPPGLKMVYPCLHGRFNWPASVSSHYDVEPIGPSMPQPIELTSSELLLQLAAGAPYLDVRSAEEYALGHVPGAYNIPLQHGSPSGLQPNPEFEVAAAAAFPKDGLLIVGCHSGARALRAAARLTRLGFSRVLLHREGWDGSRDAFGRRLGGWAPLGHPREQQAPAGRTYADLRPRRALRPLTIAYFGLPLGALLLQQDGHELGFVSLSPIPAPGKRRLARQLRCPILDAGALGDAHEGAVDARFRATAVDLLVSWFWTRRLPERWLEQPAQGALGVHPSLLPRHRGPNPYFWAIDSGDEHTGVSVHQLTAAYDEGDVLLTRSLEIGERNAWQLARALDRPSLALLRHAVHGFAAGHLPKPTRQDPTRVTWAPEPSDAELGFDARWERQRVLRRIRALSPVPGLQLDIAGLELLVSDAHGSAQPLRALEPGQAAVWGDPPELLLRVADGAIVISRALVVDAGGEVQLRGAALAARVAAHLAADASLRRGP
jgi:methionyl-tRNA formyltransferase